MYDSSAYSAFTPIAVGPIPPRESFERSRLKRIQRYKQMVSNRQQLMVKVAELTASLTALALEHGSFATRLREFRDIQLSLSKLADMEGTMTERIGEFVIDHGYFWGEV